jgi:hypothetical protein
LLMDYLVFPFFAEMMDKALAAEVARNLHPAVRTSSRTKCKRIAAGRPGRSK